MVRITEDLIRKKAEHHDGTLTDLEELTLHQMEIEKIEVVGTACRKLQILYLQNNIISKMENLHHLHSLQYLNLALNNISKIEGLSGCEFLRKLDFTVNFIDLDTLQEGIEHLQPLLHLRELYLMGNPCVQWEGHRHYIGAMLPQLTQLDGKEYTRSERITARQQLPSLRVQLHALANEVRHAKGMPQEAMKQQEADGGEEEKAEPYTPEVRTRMYREMAEQKAEQESRRRAMEPRDRDYKAEHEQTLASVRAKEAEGKVRQTNEGRWEFSVEDNDGHGNCTLRLCLSRYLDTSLIDVDVHPSYVSIVIKGKIFRLLWPEEVKAGEGECKRSQTTGELLISVPRVRPSLASRVRGDDGSGVGAGGTVGGQGGRHEVQLPTLAPRVQAKKGPANNNTRVLQPTKAMKLADELASIALREVGSTTTTAGTQQQASAPVAAEECTAQQGSATEAAWEDNSEVPPLE